MAKREGKGLRVSRDGKRIEKNSRKLILQGRSFSFRCVHCRTDVPTNTSGTAHRNHCSLCLWSRHVDEAIGDRKSDCLSSMKPMGLTIKNNGGELMVVHRCLGCGKISKNRIAADDNAYALLLLLRESLGVSHEDFSFLQKAGIDLCYDEEVVRRILFGD